MSRVRIVRRDGQTKVVTVSRTGKVTSELPACESCQGTGLADVAARLEYLRSQIDAQCISYGEIAELQGLAEHIDTGCSHCAQG
jgi:hypothetical protein